MRKHTCPWWLAYTFDNPVRFLFHNPEKIFKPYVAEGMTVMDVGCGMGFFSIGLARIVGKNGCVISADLQQKMLDTLMKRAEKAGISDRIHTHRTDSDNLALTRPVDFILAFWMVHEVPDEKIFFQQIGTCLKTEGKILIAEPKVHVSSGQFDDILNSAEQAGLVCIETPSIRLSRSAVLKHGS